MAFQQFGQSRPQLPPDPRLQQDPNQVPDGGDAAAPPPARRLLATHAGPRRRYWCRSYTSSIH